MLKEYLREIEKLENKQNDQSKQFNEKLDRKEK